MRRVAEGIRQAVGQMIGARFVDCQDSPFDAFDKAETVARIDKALYIERTVLFPFFKVGKTVQVPGFIEGKTIQVASEDNLFLDHNGFDIEQIQKARDEAEKGKRVRGASTISQQTAKNVFLLPTKSYIRKGIEAYFTLLIEWIWGKERIMEVYLNSIEMGDGVYGAEAVAQAHFKKPAARLSAGEAALIAASLPNPRKFNSGKPSPYMLKRQGQILSLMGKLIKIQMGHGAGEIENKDGKIKKRKKWRASLFTTSDVSLMPTL